MNEILNKIITHNFCLNNIEEIPEDKSILKFKAVVMDFKKSHNGWAVSKDTVEKHMHTLVNKHIVTKYYSEEENDGIDALGNHEPDTNVLRGTNGEVEIPITNTRSIGTITKVYIAPLESNNVLSEEVLWCEGILLAWDNINECSLLLEWFNNNIPILASVEWYYTQNMIDNDGVEWIVDPTFSALTILNSEQRGNKDIVYGNYDCSHIELMLNNEHYKEFNSAIIKDINTNINRKGEIMENIFLKALNDISFGGIRGKIFEALAKVMIAEEYNKLYLGMWDIYNTYFIYETYIDEEWVRFKVEYTKDEEDNITVDYEGRKQVVRQDICVEVSEAEKAVNEIKEEINAKEIKLNETVGELEKIKEELLNSKNEQIEINSKLEEIKSENEKLKKYEEEINQIKYNEKLDEVSKSYEKDFEMFNSIEKFNEEEIQSLIADTLDSEKSFNATLELKDILLECAKNNKINSKDKNNISVIEGSKSLNNLVKPSKEFVDNYGFDING